MTSFPSYIQPDAIDCGPVSLKMIAKYYGKESLIISHLSPTPHFVSRKIFNKMFQNSLSFFLLLLWRKIDRLANPKSMKLMNCLTFKN